MLNIIDESLRSLNEQITNKFEERIKEALRTWGVDPDDLEEVKEYLSLRYYSITRCLLTDLQKLEIAKNEIEYMSKNN